MLFIVVGTAALNWASSVANRSTASAVPPTRVVTFAGLPSSTVA
jgi:hypothetical protein